MADEIDLAQEREQRLLDEALAVRRERRCIESAPPAIADGVRLCIDCGAAIAKRRLKAQPNAVRYTGCQTVHEQRQRRIG